MPKRNLVPKRGAALLLLALFAVACDTAQSASDAAVGGADMGMAEVDTLPPGWSEASHTKKGDPDYAKVYPQDSVARIDITISAADWKKMQDDMVDLAGEFGKGGGFGGMGPGFPDGGGFPGFPDGGGFPGFPDGGMPPGGGNIIMRDPVYVPCAVVFGDKQWNHVGIRFKGNSSLASAWGSGIGKLPLHLSFDKYEDSYPLTKDQRIWGFKELSLSNAQGDLSFIREKVANDIFRAAGIPAPLSAFYRVYVDFGKGPTYFGLYTANELPASPLLETLFQESKGNLYKPEGTHATWAGFDEESFEKKSNEDKKDWSDVKAAIAALHADRTDAAAWRQELAKSFNAEGFMRWLAVNTLIANWDAYGRMAHNYYLYGLTSKVGQLQWVQWDSSLALQSGMGLSFTMSEVGDSWPLIRYTMDDAEYQKLYYDALKATAAGAFSEAATTPRFQAAHALVAPYVVGSQGEIAGYTFLSDPASFEKSVDELNAHVRSRLQALDLVLATH